MNKLNRDIRHFYFINNHDLIQDGGSRKPHEIIYNGRKIYYNTLANVYGDINTIVISGGRDAGRRPCFQLLINNQEATLQSLERGKDCFVDRYDNTKDIVLASFELAKNKGCTIFQLVDNSFKSCPPYRFNLSDVYFLTEGRTWYESILPIKIVGRDESEIAELRRRAKTTTWLNISTYLLSIGVNIYVDITDIPIDKPGSAMILLRRIKTMKNELSCKFFAENTNRILFASNIPSFHGTLWKFEYSQ
jgi:hypothetical protein